MLRDGAAYLASLKGRQIYEAGRLLENPAEDSGTARTAQFIAGLLNECRSADSEVSENGVLLAYKLASSSDDVRARGRAFAAIARRSGGLMGRSPDFLATILTAWRGAADSFGEYADNVVRYWENAGQANLVLTHAISDPPADRHLPADAKGPLRTLRAVRETDEGIVVRGAKMLATLAPFADDLLVYPFRPLAETEADQALCFAVPVSTPGLTLYCRPSLARRDVGDHPLSAVFDEMDAICVFDDVLIPWERVFINQDLTRANNLRAATGMTAYAWHQSAVRAWIKAELVFELANSCAKVSGKAGSDPVRQQLGELAGIAESMRALVVSAEAGARQDEHGHFIADPVPLATSGMLNATLYPRAIELLQLVVGSGLIMHPLTADEAEGSPAHDYFQHYFAGVGADGVRHGRLLRAAADLALDAFGGRQMLYERLFLGPPDAFRAKFYDQYQAGRGTGGMLSCLLP